MNFLEPLYHFAYESVHNGGQLVEVRKAERVEACGHKAESSGCRGRKLVGVFEQA